MEALSVIDCCPPVGPKRHYVGARNFMCDMVMEKIPPELARNCYTHFTCATDTKNIKKVFDDVRNTIMSGNIGDSVNNV